jgi:hypothetical protein
MKSTRTESRTARAAVSWAALAGLILVSGACFDRAPTSGQDEALPAPAEPVEPAFDQPFDPAWLSMRSPIRVAAVPGDRFLVSDSRLRAILRIRAATGEADQAFAVEGKPLAVGMRGDRIFVGNVTTGTVDVYAANGGFRQSFGQGAAPYPMDLAIDDRLGLVFVVAGGTREVKVFDLDGGLQRSIGGAGSGSPLHAPTGVALDASRREVLVSDYGTSGGHASVKIFDYDGTFVAEISGDGECGMAGCTAGFSRPQGMAVDAESRIYLADALLGQVLVFDRATRQLLTTLGDHAADGGNLRLPMDVTLGARGEVVVVSNGTASVELVQ